MTLVLRPVGRGNWTPLVLRIEGHRATPILVAKNDRLQLGGITFRVVEVRP